MKELSREECFEIFKKYDPQMYNYYTHYAYFFDFNARNYAEFLLRQNKGEKQ